MRKLSLILALSLVMVIAFAGVALAAQARIVDSVYGDSTYVSTSQYVYNETTGEMENNAFSNDGESGYPFEIYLPNEGNPAAYRIHTNYTKDTDACASCHATHTAVGESLLQWYTVYDTCMACHDGTVTTTYNVQEGEIGDTGTATFGGMFGNGTEGSLSNHNVQGGLSVAAAPGGSTVGESYTVGHKSFTAWETEFGCQSCHSPHGQGGNARILNPDVNAYAEANWGTFTTQMSGLTAVVYDGTDVVYALQGYPYSTQVFVDGTEVSSGYTLSNAAGYTEINFTEAPAGTVTVAAYPSLRVTMTVANYLQADESVTHESGMNAFCGACHADYNTEDVDESGAVLSGTYAKAYRHKVGRGYHPKAGLAFEGDGNDITCQTCHVAHGTSDDYWARTIAKTGSGTEFEGESIANLVELSGSSALKRMPNMGTCEACHDKSAGNEGYLANAGQDAADAPQTTNTSDYVNFDASSIAVNYAGTADRYTNVPALVADGETGAIFNGSLNYVGSDACQSCHADYYEGWKEEGHVRSLQTAEEATNGEHGFDVLAEFDTYAGQTITKEGGSGDYQYTFAADGSEFTYSDGTDTYTVTKADVANALIWMDHYVLKQDATDTAVYYRIAGIDPHAAEGEPMIGPYLSHGSGMPSAPSTVSWYADGAAKTGAGEGCLSCHAPKLEVAKGTPDATIGCESCHGPAERHVIQPTTKNIMNPATQLSFEQQTNLCSNCHTARHNTIDDFKTSDHYLSETATCATCHDVHNKHKGGTENKWQMPEAEQLCITCHDTAVKLENAVPGGSDHSFSNGFGL